MMIWERRGVQGKSCRIPFLSRRLWLDALLDLLDAEAFLLLRVSLRFQRYPKGITLAATTGGFGHEVSTFLLLATRWSLTPSSQELAQCTTLYRGPENRAGHAAYRKKHEIRHIWGDISGYWRSLVHNKVKSCMHAFDPGQFVIAKN